ALTRLGHDLNMNIVVEGVENQEQEAILRDMGAEYLQGYLYAAPVPFDQVAELVRTYGLGELTRPAATGLATKFAS
ncbi:MAG: EAL domain-containing protein, partial [Paracoccaceae bacterium]